MRAISFLFISMLIGSSQLAFSQGSESGLLGVYSDHLHGRATASGERYDMGQLSAAHATLPLGSFARVANFDTGLMVDVKINDRKGNDNRIVTLSKAAAQRIGVSPNGAAPGSLLLISGIKVPAQQAAAPNTRAMSAQSHGAPSYGVPIAAGAVGTVAGGAVANNVPRPRGFKPFSRFNKKDPLYDAVVNKPTANSVAQGRNAVNQGVANTQAQVNQKSGGLFKNGLFGNRAPKNAQVATYAPAGSAGYAYPELRPLSAPSAIPSPEAPALAPPRAVAPVAAPPTQRPVYRVQFGAFRKQANAIELARGLGGTGIATSVVPVPNSKLNAVIFNGGFASPGDAQNWINAEAARRGWREKPVVIH